MTDLTDPTKAEVFIVGRNQATAISAEHAGDHDEYMEALFNRNGQSCRTLYDRARAAAAPSRSRINIDKLTAKLKAAGITGIIETNVCCYSTPMSADLARAEHADGRQRGHEIFVAVLECVRPRVLVAHGDGTVRELAHVLGTSFSAPPSGPTPPAITKVHGRFDMGVITIPSLAPPAWNKWSAWADAHLDAVAKAVVGVLRGS